MLDAQFVRSVVPDLAANSDASREPLFGVMHTIKKYKVEFHIPPSYYRLAKLCQARNRDVEAYGQEEEDYLQQVLL